MDVVESSAKKSLIYLFRTLKYRNYRLFFMGQSISLIGTWLQMIAVSWLVYRLTGSVFMLGLVGFLSRIPTFLMAPFAGVVADRYDRYKILILTQILSMIQAFIFAVLVFTGTIQVWHTILLGISLGLINSFDIPVRQSFVVNMVEDKKDLGNAIALNSSMVNGARLIGPTVAGLLIAAVGEGWCFSLNAISFVAVISSLLMMKIKPREFKRTNKSGITEFKEGFSYAYKHKTISSLLLLLAIASLIAMPYQVLMPAFSREILKGGPKMFGFLMAAAGFGALAGALYLGSRKSTEGLGRIVILSSVLFGAGLMMFSFAQNAWSSGVFLVIAGFGMMVQAAGTNTILQTLVEEDKRGRIMSLYTMAFMGMQPFGSLLVGKLADVFGMPVTICIGGAGCGLSALLIGRKMLFLKTIDIN
ncbi:MAG: MFS transporter [Candidatus Firestonebacteria bacterium RIFOXYC2_FULL_39_67]|nr:MAG: MFS transporter [Candidatus Firestonebacteria bacterium RIFOXYD2_FULL_39_29]OGF54231.1 MAG: MFS transporter [Candidatus Firestonebacteria bacterium RIFOXYC2_FULL_39_67]